MKRHSTNSRVFAVASDGAVDWDHPINRGRRAWWLSAPGVAAAGGRLLDLCGRTHATLTNGPVWIGRVGGFPSLSFDGVNDYAVTPAIDLTGTSAVTLTFSLVWTAFANNDLLAFEFSANYNSQTTGFAVAPNDSGTGTFVVALKGDVNYNNARYARPTAGVEYRYAAVFDKTQATDETDLYRDGQLLTPASRFTSSNTNAFGSHQLYFMSRGGAALLGAGRLRDISLHTRRLSATEIALDNDLFRRGYRGPDSPLRWETTKSYLLPTTTTSLPTSSLFLPSWLSI